MSYFEELCEGISYLKPVPPFWGNIADKVVLDLACSDGWISLSIGKSGAYVFGFDISSKRIELAKRYMHQMGWLHCFSIVNRIINIGLSNISMLPFSVVPVSPYLLCQGHIGR